MQLIPVGNSIVYVRPFYVQGRGSGAYPQFQFVVVFSQDYGAFCATDGAGRPRPDARRAQTVTTCNVVRARSRRHRHRHGHDHDDAARTATTTGR